MIVLPFNELKPGMIVSKSVYDEMGQMLIPKGTQLNHDHLLRLSESRIDRVDILDVEKLIQKESKRRAIVKDLVTQKYEFHKQTIQNMTMIRRHSFHSDIKNFLIPHVMEEPDGLSQLERIERLLNVVFDLPKLEPYFARIVSLYLHAPTFRKTVAVAMIIALELGLDEGALLSVAKASIFYNIGYFELIEEKIQQRLIASRRECQFSMEDRKRHCLIGYEMFKQLNDEQTARMILEHHEQRDGSGFPNQLTSDQISIGAKIIHLAKAFAKLSTPKPDQAHFATDQAYAIISENAQMKFEPEIVDAFVKWFKPYPIGSFLELSDGSICIVIGQNNANRLKPRVYMLETYSKTFPLGVMIDLERNEQLSIRKFITPTDAAKMTHPRPQQVLDAAYI